MAYILLDTQELLFIYRGPGYQETLATNLRGLHHSPVQAPLKKQLGDSETRFFQGCRDVVTENRPVSGHREEPPFITGRVTVWVGNTLEEGRPHPGSWDFFLPEMCGQEHGPPGDRRASGLGKLRGLSIHTLMLPLDM